ncbi:scavenger receptor cysteine-rich type 1 protein M130-like isoform X2 [Neoarius graeffei]|uniref:scavenger receptor cysteine-rich type 1 protein M130-like isoform X2 n=1 Tax=Neoarius graeffei TaxID=443677 RepID=UPI00298D1458|nr:scavenger receptor cysteine-rich type 1 protein M130-like isoform X2 [Neoarius graeffei]
MKTIQNLYRPHTHYTLTQRIILRGSTHPCEGRLEVYYKQQWGLVGHHKWEPKNGEVVCKSLDCGDHVASGILYHNYKNLPPLTTFWMDEIMCNGTEDKLWKCNFSGWNVTQCQNDNYVSVKCSGNISLTLIRNGVADVCAGVVQFTSPSGNVNTCTEINKDIATKVCKELNCGEHKKILTSSTFNSDGILKNMPLNCIGNEDFLWQCVDWESAMSKTCQEEKTIICANHRPERLQGGVDVCQGTLEESSTEGQWANVACQESDYNMFNNVCVKLGCGTFVSVKPCNESKNTWLKCSTRVKVELRQSGQRTTNCYGDIYVSTNDSSKAVCVNDATSYQKIGEVVCRELDCGTPLSVSQSSLLQHGQFSHAECYGQEKSVWECIYKHDTIGKCQTINVICSGSLVMRLSNGLDKCAGQLEVKLLDSWWSMSSDGWSKKNSGMVCQHLECGALEENSQHRFVKSNSRLLDWKLACKSSHISNCSLERKKYNKNDAVVNIICNKHELWFLQGDSPCEGRVKSETGGYLQNITNEKANEVCARNLCGTTESYTSNMDSSVCPENATSPFNCSIKNTTTLTEPQFAYVKCSGSMRLQLKNKCHGKVQVCSNENCMDLCKDTWMEKQSGMLCKSLGCGMAIRQEYNGMQESGVNLASVHCSQTAENFSQCNFFKLNNTSFCQNPAYVFCTGSVKAELHNPRDKCAGNLQLFYSGKWQSVCTDINPETQNAICTNLGCGEAVSFNRSINMFNSDGLTSITCQDGNISNCDFSNTKVQRCQVGHLNCTGWRRLLLNSTETACMGKVYLRNQSDLYAVSSDGWSETERNELCNYLECGKVSETVDEEHMNKAQPFWSRSYNCSGNPQNIWECEKDEAPVEKHHLHINCTDEPQVNLTGKCTGEVQLKNEYVCSTSQNTDRVFKEFCQELGCSMLFKTWPTKKISEAARYLSCTGMENKLWQCSSWTDTCENVISLACAGAIEWKLRGTCGGEFQVKYRGKWEPVCPLEKNDADRICMELKCGNAREVLTKSVENEPNPDVRFQCGKNHNYPMHCFRPENCKSKAVIDCENEPQVNLTGKCSGEVQLKNEHVCFTSQNTDSVYNKFCQELGCSMFFKTWPTKKNSKARYLSCTGMENKLGHCSSWTDTCENVVSLACAEAIEWKLSSTCGGEFQVKYRGKWEPVCPVEKNDADRICMELKCGNAREVLTKSVENEPNPDVGFQCRRDHNYLMHCFGPNNCTAKAVIYCDNYDSVNKTGLIVGVVVGLALLLVVAALILYWKRETFLTRLRFKFSSEDTDVEINENEMQNLNEKDNLENSSEDYDDIGTTVNPREENQSEVSTSENDEENMSTSQSSSGTDYDEADEENAKPPANSNPTEPLLPPRPDNLLDKVTFEAEVEPQEDYDDVILPQTVVSEQKERLSIPGPSSNPP